MSASCSTPRWATPLLIAAGAAVALTGCGSDEPDIRHVILVSLDTTRADHLGCYGNDRVKTPAIDRLAREGVRFRDVTSPAPTTLTAHTSLMTGSWPETHGVVRNGFMVNPDNRMLAEVLQDAGFHTAGFLGSFALERRFGFNQGFQHFDEEFDILVTAEGWDQNQRRADRVTDAVLRHVDEVDEERLFLFVHYFDAHQPYAPPPSFARMYAADGALFASDAADVQRAVGERHLAVIGEELAVSELVDYGLPPELIEEATGKPGELDRTLADLYAAEVSFVDAELGRLLDGLEARGILEHALVIVTSDHGETFWEHGDAWNHGLWVYQTTIAVPLILRFPGQRFAGTVVDGPVSTIDLLPTLAELLDLRLGERVDGVSALPAILGEPFARGPLFSQATQPGSRIESNEEWGNARKPRCVRDGPWKYVFAPYLELEQLFNLDDDPTETRNLLRETPPSTEVLEQRSRLAAELDNRSHAAAPLPSHMNRVQLRETLRRLEQLGYGGDR